MRIQDADAPEFVDIVRALFREYESTLNVNLCFQGFEKELANLPGEYARPSGRLLVAFEGGEAAGCGAFRGLESDICEMKRLFVRPKYQGKAIGSALARALIEGAQAAGYKRMRLDTMPTMQKAIALYRSLGFEEIPAYRFNPVPGSLFLELQLSEANLSRKL
jgi:putative acetyltransferase